MRKAIISLWDTAWLEVDKAGPRLFSLGSAWATEVWDQFPLGWIKPVGPPYFIWIIQRTVEWITAQLDWFEDLLTVVPAVVIANVALSQLSIDPKLRQRVMTLDQVALFPARIIIDLGLRRAFDRPLPREFLIAERMTKLDKLFALIKVPSFAKLKSVLFGSVWMRVLKLIALAVKWGQVVGYLGLLYRYVEHLENKSDWGALFSAQLTDKHPRKKETVRIRRRVGGVPP